VCLVVTVTDNLNNVCLVVTVTDNLNNVCLVVTVTDNLNNVCLVVTITNNFYSVCLLVPYSTHNSPTASSLLGTNICLSTFSSKIFISSDSLAYKTKSGTRTKQQLNCCFVYEVYLCFRQKTVRAVSEPNDSRRPTDELCC